MVAPVLLQDPGLLLREVAQLLGAALEVVVQAAQALPAPDGSFLPMHRGERRCQGSGCGAFPSCSPYVPPRRFPEPWVRHRCHSFLSDGAFPCLENRMCLSNQTLRCGLMPQAVCEQAQLCCISHQRRSSALNSGTQLVKPNTFFLATSFVPAGHFLSAVLVKDQHKPQHLQSHRNILRAGMGFSAQRHLPDR